MYLLLMYLLDFTEIIIEFYTCISVKYSTGVFISPENPHTRSSA